MAFKIIGGTPKTAASLCITCRNATRVRGQNLQQIIHCSELHRAITFPVAECSEYDDKRIPALWDMEKIAWMIQTRERGPAGFQGSQAEIEIVPPKKNNSGPD